VALHDIRHGSVVALAIAQMRSGHDLHQLQPSYPDDENLDDNQELVEDFEGVTEAVANITQDEEVINNVFFSP
jgi:hypothetical protein